MQIGKAADALKMSRQWLWRLINEGEITTDKIAGHRFVVVDSRFKAMQRKRSNGKARK